VAQLDHKLSAPEAYLLLSLPLWDARKALKLGFMGLVAQGILRLDVEDRRGLLRTRHIPHLHLGPSLPEHLPPVAASLVQVVRSAQPEGLIPQVLRQCQRAYRSTLSDFVLKHLGPALAARGLAEPYRRRLLGLIPVDAFRRTPAGDAEKQRIEGLMNDARTIPRFLDRDPAQAAALVAALGGAILLVEELRPYYGALGVAMRDRDGGDGGDVYFDTSTFDTGSSGGSFDFGSIDFSCFDGGAFDSFDAGFADAGGGDGGGGDGGSSSC
jgi:hypothetical protein